MPLSVQPLTPLLLASVCWSLLPPSPVQADIVPSDLGTLVNTLPGGCTTGNCGISGGLVSSNGDWFLRFSEFSIDGGITEATFITPGGVERIYSLVNGPQSFINNQLTVLDNALSPEVFFINPNGIRFGPAAQLNLPVGSSFTASTADTIVFASGIAAPVATASPALLNVDVPTGLQLGTLPADIVNEGVLLLNGGDLTLEGGNVISTGQLVTQGGQVSITAETGNIEISGSTSGVDLSGLLLSVDPTNPSSVLLVIGTLNTLEGINTSNFDLFNPTNGGDITLMADNGSITINDSAFVQSIGLLGSGGDITATSRDALQVLNNSGIASIGGLLGTGGAIALTSTAGDIVLTDGFVVGVAAITGSAGDITADAAGAINITSNSIDSGLTTSGNIIVQSDQLTITNNSPDLPSGVTSAAAGLSTITQTNSNAGNIHVDSRIVTIRGNDDPMVADPLLNINSPTGTLTGAELAAIARAVSELSTGISSSTSGSANPGNTGNAGEISINTQRLSVQYGAGVTSGTVFASQGNGNLIDITATESITLQGFAAIANGIVDATGSAGDIQIQTPTLMIDDGAGIAADAVSPGGGAAGNLLIDATTIALTGGGRIGAATSSSGNAGTLTIPNASQILVEGTYRAGTLSSRIFFDSTNAGDAGRINLTTQALNLQNGGRISGRANDTGDGGILNLNATNVLIDGDNSGFFFDSTNVGNAGRIDLTTQALNLQNGGRISGRANNTGDGGILNLSATNVLIDGANSGLFFDSTNAGNARGIQLSTGDLVVQNGGQVSVSGSGTGQSGSLDIGAGTIRLNQAGRLTAETAANTGGNIRLNVASDIVLRNDGSSTATEISASALGSANGGNIDIVVADGVIVAVLSENSDIVAASESGAGGRITATAQDILGFREFNGERTPESDFTATGEIIGLDGDLVETGIVEVTIDPVTPAELPTNIIEPAVSTDACAAGQPRSNRATTSRFVVVGQGGLPQGLTAAAAETLIVPSVDPVLLESEMTHLNRPYAVGVMPFPMEGLADRSILSSDAACPLRKTEDAS